MDHTIIHFEIPANNAQKLSEFYSNLFNWKFVHSPVEGMDYWIILTVPVDDKGNTLRFGVNGGMFTKSPEQKDFRPVNYIKVENIDESIKKVKHLGGNILVSKQHVPTVGFIAIGLDPEGNSFGLLQPESM